MPKIDDVEIIRIPGGTIAGINLYVWIPRWSWFRPPKNKFFKWAYRVLPVNRNQRVYPAEVVQKAFADYMKKEGNRNESDDGHNSDDSRPCNS